MTRPILSVMQSAPVVPVMVINKLEQAVPLAKTLVDAGLPVLEITLRTAPALEAIKLIKAEVPNAIVGAGTVINPANLQDSIAAGAEFIVSPGSTAALIDAALEAQIPLLPGVNTPSEVMALLDRGLTEMKFFPAEAAGGVAMLKSMASPLPQVSFCPTGGISLNNAPDYLALPNVACVGGSWMVAPTLVDAENWDEIGKLASAAAALAVS